MSNFNENFLMTVIARRSLSILRERKHSLYALSLIRAITSVGLSGKCIVAKTADWIRILFGW